MSDSGQITGGISGRDDGYFGVSRALGWLRLTVNSFDQSVESPLHLRGFWDLVLSTDWRLHHMRKLCSFCSVHVGSSPQLLPKQTRPSCTSATAHTGLRQFLEVYCTFPCFLGLSLGMETLVLFIPHWDRCTSRSSPIPSSHWEGPTLADLNEQTMCCTKSQPRAFTLAWGLIHKEADAKFPLSCRSLF